MRNTATLEKKSVRVVFLEYLAIFWFVESWLHLVPCSLDYLLIYWRRNIKIAPFQNKNKRPQSITVDYGSSSFKKNNLRIIYNGNWIKPCSPVDTQSIDIYKLFNCRLYPHTNNVMSLYSCSTTSPRCTSLVDLDSATVRLRNLVDSDVGPFSFV